jgi:2-dehydropantoate 2-reductase
MNSERVLVIGAGVVGQVYGGRLAGAGHDVTMLARGETAAQMSAMGITLSNVSSSGSGQHVPVAVVTELPNAPFDTCIVAVRADQTAGVIELVRAVRTTRLVFLQNAGTHLHELTQLNSRAVFAFPGVGGTRDPGGAVRYLQVPQQHTTVGRAGGRETAVAELLRTTGMPVTVIDDMSAWLQSHIVFLVGVGAALLTRGADAQALAADRTQVRAMIMAIREGFGALSRGGTTPTPAAVRTIFTRVPIAFAARYWSRQLAGPVGTLAIAPHVAATRGNEMPVLAADVRKILDANGPTPRFDALLGDAGM